jgi:serine/threonine kinase PknH
MSDVSPRSTDATPIGATTRHTGRPGPVVGATALAALVVLGTVGVALGGGPEPSGPSVVSIKDVATSSDSSTSTTSAETSASASATTTSASPEAPPAPSPLDKLYAVLPPGYNSTLCGPSDDPSPQALATVDCGQLGVPDGPASARFSLFADANALAGRFQDGVNGNAISQCPDSIDSPTSWHYAATPAFSAGSLACGTHDNEPALTWTKDDVLLLGDVRGPSLDNLYGWWLSLG